jgi:pyruvate dehydrogenase E2 component (dihydrolipoamide acetyltransferase)
MPKLGLTMETGRVVSWKKREGDPVAKGETLLEVETDKIVTEVQSPQSGQLLKILVTEDTEVKVQAVLAVVGQAGEDISSILFASAGPAESPAAAAQNVFQATEATPGPAEARDAAHYTGRLRITPRARKLLADRGFSLADLEGLGKIRITEADVQEFLARQGTETARQHQGGAAAAEPGPPGQIQPPSRIERIIAERMTASFRDIPQFSLRFAARMDRLLALLPRWSAAAGRDITINDLILRGTAMALSRFPDVQCQWRRDGIFQPASVNLGFAVAQGRDLLVPVIRDADKKRIAEISREAAELAERARNRRLRPEEVTGGTFTVSNLGMFGISSFAPIVNPGEGAILGVGAVVRGPVLEEDKITAGSVLELTLVCDHRSVNGVIGAGFCRELKGVLELAEEAAW